MRALILVGLVAVAVALFVVLKDDDSGSDSTTTETTATTATGTQTAPGQSGLEVDVKGGKPVGGVQELTVKKGDPIRFTVNSDVAEQVHLHGYDVSKDVKAGGSVSFSVPASLEGVFEAELEHSHTQILEVRVEPG